MRPYGFGSVPIGMGSIIQVFGIFKGFQLPVTSHLGCDFARCKKVFPFLYRIWFSGEIITMPMLV